MKTIQELRMKLGLSQNDLAQYLGISRSHLSMCELGHRNLTSAELVKLAGVESGYYKAKEKRSMQKQAEGRSLSQRYEEISCRHRYLQYKLDKKNRELEKMIKGHEQNSHLFHVLEYLHEEGYSKNNAWITNNMTRSSAIIYRCDEIKQQVLKEHINELSAEVNALSACLGALDKIQSQ